ncbi:MAG: hypothetical protein HY751_11115 [Nitrospinae bacterium]|nr:hypothetical protein [Nitrospinota bacterium]
MITPEGRKTVEGLLKRLNVVWIILFAAVAAVAAVNIFILQSGGPLIPIEAAFITPLSAMLGIVALVDVGAIVFIDRWLKSDKGLKNYMQGRGPTAIKINLPTAGLLDDDKLVVTMLPHYFQICVIRWALAASVGIYGFVIAALSGTAYVPSLFYAAAVALLWVFRYSFEEVEALAMRARSL